jgi:hypothetical protein
MATPATNPLHIATNWLESLERALTSADTDAVLASFLDDGWLRDLLTFSWDFRTLHGTDKISEYLSLHLASSQVSNVKLDTQAGLAPSFVSLGPGFDGYLEASFTFDNVLGSCRGMVNLKQDESQQWKAFIIFVMLDELRGAEEHGHESGLYGGHTVTFQEVLEKQIAEVEHDPQVLIGTHCAGRFDCTTNSYYSGRRSDRTPSCGAVQADGYTSDRYWQDPEGESDHDSLRCLSWELPQVGDTWRLRWVQIIDEWHVAEASFLVILRWLCTQRARTINVSFPIVLTFTWQIFLQVLYTPFPSNWPTFTPKEKLSDWFEHYAISQELVVWTNTKILPTPSYDETSNRWTVHLQRGDKELVMHPVHVVIATGTLGDPITPVIPGQDVFGGEIMHSSAFPGGQAFSGKRAVVVGAGNTSVDLCQDLVHRGATSVTMVQRSSSIVVSKDYMAGFFSSKWPEGVPYEINDFRMAAMPLGPTKDILRAFQPLARDFDKEMHDGLRSAGIALNEGPDGAGLLWALFNRFGGTSSLAVYRVGHSQRNRILFVLIVD